MLKETYRLKPIKIIAPFSYLSVNLIFVVAQMVLRLASMGRIGVRAEFTTDSVVQTSSDCLLNARHRSKYQNPQKWPYKGMTHVRVVDFLLLIGQECWACVKNSQPFNNSDDLFEWKNRRVSRTNICLSYMKFLSFTFFTSGTKLF